LSRGAHNKLNVRLPAGSTLEFELQNEEKIVKKYACKVTTEEDIRESTHEDQQRTKSRKKQQIFRNDVFALSSVHLIPCSRSILKTLTVPQLVQKLLASYRTPDFITALQQPATCSYPEPFSSVQDL